MLKGFSFINTEFNFFDLLIVFSTDFQRTKIYRFV